MFKIYKIASVVMLLLLFATQGVMAAKAPVVPVVPKFTQPQVDVSLLQHIRYSQTPQKIRIVFDVTKLPTFSASLLENPDRLVVDLSGIVAKETIPAMTFEDQVITNVEMATPETGKLKVIINLKKPAIYKIFTLANPNRIVLDIMKEVDQKVERELVPGIKYISLSRTTQAGPVSTHIINMSAGTKYMIQPALSNDAVTGLERLKSIADNNKALVGINASYFALNGEILGLLKMDGEVVSTSTVERTVLGILPDGKIKIDQTDYKGSISLPDGKMVAITGVNHERGPNDLILYNNHFDSMTGTNQYGTDYIINKDKITAITHGNAAIPPGCVVLSAHGSMEKVLASLKVGDAITINQTLGKTWDEAPYALGAGPRLIKDGGVFLTSKEEEFPGDIISGRAPRTAVGLTKEGNIILLVVDGRQQHSVGMTLLELALFMQEFGVVDAMNLDGGGSSEMVVEGKIVNQPSDGKERPVGNALLIVPKI